MILGIQATRNGLEIGLQILHIEQIKFLYFKKKYIINSLKLLLDKINKKMK